MIRGIAARMLGAVMLTVPVASMAQVNWPSRS